MVGRYQWVLPLCLIAIAICGCAASAQEAPGSPVDLAVSRESVSAVGRGPTDVTEELKRSESTRGVGSLAPALSESWYGFKNKLKNKHNFEFGVAYTAIYQRASEDIVGGTQGVALLTLLYDYLILPPVPVMPTKKAAGGIFEFNGKWTVIQADEPDRGFIGFSVQNTGRLGSEIPPQSLFLDAGAFWPTATSFSEFDLSIVSLYYEQYFAEGALGVRVGKYSPFGIYDYMSLKDPSTDFLNAAFNLNPAIGWASWGFGIAGVVRPMKQLYVVGGIHDINGGPNQGIESFFSDKEYFKAVEIGWDTELACGKGNLHLLLWDTDKRASTDTPSSRGMTVGGEQQFGRWLPFFRYGYSEGGGTPLRHLVAGGVGIKNIFGRPTDIIGVGVSWGEPIDDQVFADQKAVEVYYRFYVTDAIAITPNVQYIKDPPLNLAKDELYLLGIRGRAAF